MTQVLPRYCPRCGAPIVSSSGACATCGLSFEATFSSENHKVSEHVIHTQERLPEIDQEATQHDLAIQQVKQLDKAPTIQLGEQGNSFSGTQLSEERVELPYPDSSAPTKRSIGRRGFLILAVVILFVVGTVVYSISGLLGVALPGFVNEQPPVTTTAINSTIPYAGIDVTILNVQQSQSFVKDPNTSDNGMVRLNLREHNITGVKVIWNYATIARLIVKSPSLVSPTYVNSLVSVAPGTTQTSIVDFAVPLNYSVTQLILVVGATNEAQMFIPLKQNADLSKYQAKTINLNRHMQYFGLNWTLASATSSLSIQGQQASKNKRYMTVTLKVDNTLSQVAIAGSAYEYIRLHYVNTAALPEHITIPVAFNVGAIGITGTVSFQVPQNLTSFTLILEPQAGDSGDQASTNFQMP
jgi:uncharacterized Zn finger protein (UPF0148 family)